MCRQTIGKKNKWSETNPSDKQAKCYSGQLVELVSLPKICRTLKLINNVKTNMEAGKKKSVYT